MKNLFSEIMTKLGNYKNILNNILDFLITFDEYKSVLNKNTRIK